MTLTVDEYVKTNVLPQHQDIVKAIRDMVHNAAPDAKEYMAYGIPVWKCKKILSVLSPNKKTITFSFTHGAEFDDKYGLLKGVGKLSRHVKIRELKEMVVHEAALRYYIQQALVFDAK